MEPTTQIKSLKLPFAKSYAFVIGIDAYEDMAPLSTAVKDANDIADLLEDKEMHGYTVFRLLDAKKAQILDLFGQMKELVQRGDRVIFYFAGHGVAHDSEGDPEGFLVPADAKRDKEESWVSMDLLHQTLNDLPCKHGLLILDCCFAGAFKWSGTRSMGRVVTKTLYAERFLRFVDNPAWQVITSAAHDQKAADILDAKALGLREAVGEEAKFENSPFAWALKKAIQANSQADTSGLKRSDGVITATELYIFLREIVEKATRHKGKRQSPAIFTLSKHDTKGEYIFLNPGHPLNLPMAPNHNPYKGLDAYSVADEHIFFGRQQAVDEMADKLDKTSLLLVSAPSGQGKSSTVKAGLFPHLEKLGYRILPILRPGDRSLTNWKLLMEAKPSEKMVLLIDQFEELYGLPEGERCLFEQLLYDLLQRMAQEARGNEVDFTPVKNRYEDWFYQIKSYPDRFLDTIRTHQTNTASESIDLPNVHSTFKIILTIRSDFEWQLKSSFFGNSFWKDQQIRNFLYRLPPPSSEELKEIMIKPAWVVAYEFETESLVDQILEEINHAPGSLSLLSFTLRQLFEHRDQDQRLLTMRAYTDQLGGVNGALSEYADQVYDRLNKSQQRFMRKLILRMVRLNDGQYTRRRVYLKTPSNKSGFEFIDELDYPDHLDEVKEGVLKALSKALLIRNDQDELGPYIEPIHDSLINFWPRCLQWIQAFGRENLVLQRQLWQAVVDHHQWEEGIYGTPDGREPQAPLWDNNPKLQQIQIAITDPRDEWLCKKGWADKSIASVCFLLWEDQPTQTQLEEMAAWNWFFKTEDSTERYRKIRDQMDHWLNEEELVFVKNSFDRQRSEIERLKKERDEAIRAKEEAQLARERTVKEMIEASWKAGTYLEKLNDGWVRGVRDLYQRLKLLMSLGKAQSLSPVPIFLKGPHQEDFELHASEFGYYNPAFLIWAKANVIPAKNNKILRDLTLPFYNRFMREMAWVYYLSYEHLNAHVDLRDRVKDAYLLQLKNGREGGFYLQQLLRDYPDRHEAEMQKLFGDMAWYYWVVASGFWIRRHIDTTDVTFFEILEDLLSTYDADWLANPPKLPV